MYWFGKTLDSTDRSWLKDEAWTEISSKRLALCMTPLEDILGLLDKFSEVWKDQAVMTREVIPSLLKDSGFSKEEVQKTLSLLPGLLSRESLEKRVKAEFTRSEVLDGFTKLPNMTAKMKAVPNGPLLHVTAGNVFLSSIDSLVMGFLTKNISVVKVSSQNTFFPLYFAKRLQQFDQKELLADKFSILHWKGGEGQVETFIKGKVNTIIAWGGEEMIEAYRRDLPPRVKLLDFGPKVSIQVISRKGLTGKDLRKVAEKLVQDIIPWDQSACASPQNLYLEEGIDEETLMNALDEAFTVISPGGEISEDEATEILKEKYRAYYSALMEGGQLKSGPNHLLHLESNKHLRPSPLHRSLIIKRFSGPTELYHLLQPFSYYLQSCSYLLDEGEKKNFLDLLSLTGLKRFAPLGTITWGMEGAPHDGRLVLRELVHFIGDEARIQDYGEVHTDLVDSKTIKDHFEGHPHPAGYVFSSGGTSGEPKFVHFSYEEFDYMTDMLALNLKAQGISRGMTVANLFVAGNLWSSFMAVEKALEKIGAVQLPIGGLCTQENIVMYLTRFKPDVVMGIPSLLVMNAEFAQTNDINISIDKVFYAGEALSDLRRQYLARTWKTKSFGSAGYASVDAGVIGYQCESCGPGEHHLFSDLIQLEIVNGEGIVTSLCRETMPIKNYRTGDRIEWLGPCECGRSDRRFKLLGRVDNVIQIWSCRLLLSDIEKSFKIFDQDVLSYQVVLTEESSNGQVKEKMKIIYERSSNVINSDTLIKTIYENSRDLKDTISLEEFKKNLVLEPLASGKLERNSRTGKISLVKDQRR